MRNFSSVKSTSVDLSSATVTIPPMSSTKPLVYYAALIFLVSGSVCLCICIYARLITFQNKYLSFSSDMSIKLSVFRCLFLRAYHVIDEIALIFCIIFTLLGEQKPRPLLREAEKYKNTLQKQIDVTSNITSEGVVVF